MTKFRTAMTAAALAVTLIASQAMAADGAGLAPGRPGGIHAAQHSSKLLLIGGAALVAVIAVVIATSTTSNATCNAACAVTPGTTS